MAALCALEQAERMQRVGAGREVGGKRGRGQRGSQQRTGDNRTKYFIQRKTLLITKSYTVIVSHSSVFSKPKTGILGGKESDFYG